MKNSRFTIHSSNLVATRNALVLLLKKSNRLHLLAEIEEKIRRPTPDKYDRVPLNRVTENIKKVATIIQEPNMGLKIASLADIENTPLFKTVLHSINIISSYSEKMPLHILLKVMAHYYKVQTEAFTLGIEEYQDKIIINLIPSMPDIFSHHQSEGATVAILRAINKLSPLKARRIQFSHAQPSDDIAIYQDILKIKPEFDRPMNSLEFSVLNIENYHDDKSYDLMAALQNLMNAQFPDASYTERCQHILKCILSLGPPNRENVAKVFNLSISSLQRRLKEEGTSFQAVLLATRMELAHEYLVTQKRRASDTAFLLGYQSASQFFNAFKKWFGLTPLQYTKKDNDSAP